MVYIFAEKATETRWAGKSCEWIECAYIKTENESKNSH